jgi:hypothetical protein
MIDSECGWVFGLSFFVAVDLPLFVRYCSVYDLQAV